MHKINDVSIYCNGRTRTMIVRSQASVSYAYSLGNLKINNIINSNAVDTEIRTVKLLGKKTANSEFFRPNDVITYNLVLTNTGNSVANHVTVNDELNHQKMVEGSFTYSFLENSKSVVKMKVSDNNLLFEIDELKPYEVCIISYQAIINDIDDISVNLQSSSSIYSKEVPPIATNKLNLKQRYAKIECEKKCVDYAYLNTEICYHLVLKNIGNAPAFDIEITDQLPQTFELAKAPDAITINDKSQDIFAYDKKTRILKLYIDKMEPQDKTNIVIKGKIIK